MNNIKKTGVKYVVTGNPGCMLQLQYGTKKFKIDLNIIHPVSLLKKAYDYERKRKNE
jgi:glycolate oxidase iron-sulfur subunit